MSGVEQKCEEGFGIIFLSNPQRHNALSLENIEEICAILESWEDLDLTAIIFTGKGKSFCSGLCLEELRKKTWVDNPISKLCDKIEGCSAVTICGLNGSAYGGGAEIALSCDFRVVSKHFNLAVPAAKLGIHYEPMGMLRALNILGPSLSRKIFLLGKKASFEDLEKTYFVDFWTEEGNQVLFLAQEIVKNLSKCAPLAVKGMKKVFFDLETKPLSEIDARVQIEACFSSEDHAEALRARQEKRPPIFKGK